MTETVAQIVTLADDYRVNEIIVEDTCSGTTVLELFQQKRGSVQCIGGHPTEDKLTRLLRQPAKIGSGKITLPKDAPWVEEFLDEVVNFPNARHDDYVDSLVQFLEWADGEGYLWLLGQIRIPLMPKETYEPWAYR